MRIGLMDERIALQSAVTSVQGDGTPSRVWTTVAWVWAARRDMTGQERYQVQQELDTRVAVFTIRYRPNVTPEWRIVDSNDVAFDIVSVAEIGRARFLEITAEVHADGR